MQKSLRGNEKEELAKLKAQGRTHHTKEQYKERPRGMQEHHLSGEPGLKVE